jgi:hypothetical protein
LHEGTYLVDINPGGRTLCRLAPKIDRSIVRVRHKLIEELVKAMAEADKAGPPDSRGIICHPSRYEVAQKAVDRVVGMLGTGK